ncbi:SusC/RagA family TonB-linked outer membrane protein [Reichenbachiella ulvae]|uniref:TonB-dependent receptor n=1 Tax=Reichenbachiella ulvae TaxID=2980104 RepID=A0ABT3CZZ6_9BACT|nr:TonB-dependent receptor [Reichenbachiella ulvae]MCV9389268.1 TonB-dependent receptor [Reichenbachiella ulvae]
MKRLFTMMGIMCCVLMESFGQNITVSGTVLGDDGGDPLPGATVVVKGTTTGTVTDIDGNYILSAPADATLVVSFIGYIKQEVPVGAQKTIDVSLSLDAAELEEVVVVGYGSQKKEAVTGAISQVEGDILMQRGPMANLTESLSGSIPGVTVLTSSGIPGGDQGDGYGGNEILIRGKNTWNNSSPLVLVDGIERNMNDVDPNDVATLTVLKDASATAVYGVKGANGVILITTKRGQIGKPTLKIDANMAFKSVSRIPRTLGSYEGLEARNAAIVNELGTNPTSWDFYTPQHELELYRSQQYPDGFNDTDWADQMLKDYGKSYKVNLGVSGGTDFVKYYGSLGYLNDGDILQTENVGQGYNPEFKYERFNFRSNFDFSLTESTKFTVNLSGYLGNQQRTGGSIHSFWYGVYAHPNDHPVLQYEDGTYGEGVQYERFGENEYVQLNFNGLKRDIRSEVLSDFKLEQDLGMFIEGLKLGGQFSFDNYFQTIGSSINDDGVATKYVDPAYYLQENADIEDYTTYFFTNDYSNSSHGFDFYDQPLQYSPEYVNGNSLGKSKRNMTYRVNLNYNRSFDKHTVTGLALFQRESGVNFNRDGWPTKREDWVGRLTYGYDKRYNVEFNGAYNGSDQFGDGKKFDFFPSVAVAWTASNEKFFKENLEWFSLLKFRYSDGIVGNDKVAGNARWLYNTNWEQGGNPTYGNNSNWAFGYPTSQAGPTYYREGTPGNPFVQWETARKQNLGIETGFFNNIITANVDLFKEHRTNILMQGNQRSVPIFFGNDAPAANLGETKSQGYEFTINYNNNHGDFAYWASFNYAHVIDETIAREDPELTPDYQKREGYQIGQTTSSISTGIIDSWDELYTGVVGENNDFLLPGDYRLLDYNGDGVINGNDNTLYGYPNRPQNTYNLTAGASYKGVSLTVTFYGAYNITTNIRLDEFAFNSSSIYQSQLDDTWSPEYGNQDPSLRALSFAKGSADGQYNKVDASFLRLKTAELAYSLPSALISKAGLSNARVFVNGNNLILWSDMQVDLEGKDYDVKNYPVTKQINFGVSISF